MDVTDWNLELMCSDRERGMLFQKDDGLNTCTWRRKRALAVRFLYDDGGAIEEFATRPARMGYGTFIVVANQIVGIKLPSKTPDEAKTALFASAHAYNERQGQVRMLDISYDYEHLLENVRDAQLRRYVA